MRPYALEESSTCGWQSGSNPEVGPKQPPGFGRLRTSSPVIPVFYAVALVREARAAAQSLRPCGVAGLPEVGLPK